MEIKAKLSNLRIAPRKVRLVADAIRNKKAVEAESILGFAVKKGAQPILKLLNSATNSAKTNYQIEKENLYIFKILVDEGPKYKRWMPRARGRASEIMKRTSHVTLVLKEIKDSGNKAKSAKKENSKSGKPRLAPEGASRGREKSAESPKADKPENRKKFYDGKETRKLASQNVKTSRLFRRKAV